MTASSRLGQRLRVRERFEHAAVHAADEHDDGVVHAARAEVRRDSKGLGDRVVVALDALEQQDDQRDHDQRHPRATGELRRRDDDRDDRGGNCSDPVDDRVKAPAARAPSGGGEPCPACESVNDRNTPTAYSGISAFVLPPNTTIRMPATNREHEHAVREHEPVAAVRELARQVAVAGDDRRQAREVGVRGVGGEREDRGRRELEEPEHEVVAEHLLAHLGEHRDLVARVRVQVVREDRHAEEQRPEDRPPSR